jgi:hypothetical protein
MHNLLRTRRLVVPWIGVGALAIAFGCGGESKKTEETREATREEHVAVAEYVNPEDSLPHLRYFDGDQVSVNNLCAVRKVRLNPKMPPVYVNGRPVGFC